MLQSKPRKSLTQLKLWFKEQHILMTLLKEFRDGILICDDQGQILQLNNSLKTLLNLTDEVVGRRVTEVIGDARFRELFESVLTTGASRVEEIRLVMGSARELFFELHVVPIFVPLVQSPYAVKPETPKSVDGCVVTFHDMTAIRRTEKIRRDFVANVSHELRTPLSVIEGYTETLLEGALEDETVCRNFVDVIYRNSLRLRQLIDALLDLSKLESSDYKPEFMPVSLPGITQQVLTLVKPKAEEKQIDIMVDIDHNLPRVSADFSSLQQVLTNLLDNAIKYTPTAGKVAVTAFEDGKGKIQVDVSDNGLGIEAKYLPRIFERFYRVDKARSRELGGGTGLGLAIVKHIVQLHGGDIWVKSQVNEGSTFSFTLDVADPVAELAG